MATGTVPGTLVQETCCDLLTEVIRASGQVQLRVAGASMLPTLWPGDLLTVHRCHPSALAPRSIIVFRQDQQLVVHRVMHRSGNRIVTRGDARARLDAPIELDQVVGRVESVLRNGRVLHQQNLIVRRVVALCLRNAEWCGPLLLRFRAKMCNLKSKQLLFANDLQSGRDPRLSNVAAP